MYEYVSRVLQAAIFRSDSLIFSSQAAIFRSDSKSINCRSKAAIFRSFAKQSSHDIRNMRGPGAQNDSAFSTASSGERRVRPRVVRRTTLHVWARCLP